MWLVFGFGSFLRYRHDQSIILLTGLFLFTLKFPPSVVFNSIKCHIYVLYFIFFYLFINLLIYNLLVILLIHPLFHPSLPLSIHPPIDLVIEISLICIFISIHTFIYAQSHWFLFFSRTYYHVYISWGIFNLQIPRIISSYISILIFLIIRCFAFQQISQLQNGAFLHVSLQVCAECETTASPVGVGAWLWLGVPLLSAWVRI